MEIIEYYLNLVDQFFLIENLKFEDNESVETLYKAVEEIVLTMKVIAEVYPDFDAIWGSHNLSKELSQLEARQDNEIDKSLFLYIQENAMTCSMVVIPRPKKDEDF